MIYLYLYIENNSKAMRKLPFRSWFYLRTGYTIYIALLLGIVNALTTTYYLAIKSIPSLQAVFPDFTTYVLTIVLIGIPLTITIGYFHYKRSLAFSSEADIQIESNPWYYKIPPGYWKEVFVPTYLELLRMNLKIAKKDEIDENDIKKFQELEDKLKQLMEGKTIGTRRTF